MTSALIADDEPHLARHLCEQLQLLWPELSIVHVARNGRDAADAIAALQPDLAFLDIRMPGLSGLEVAQGIEGGTRVVFVTAYDEYAVQAFDEAALDYLLKPVRQERLARCLRRVQAALPRRGAAAEDGTAGMAGDRGDDGRLAGVLRRLLRPAGDEAGGAIAPAGGPSAAETELSSPALPARAQGPSPEPAPLQPLRYIRAAQGAVTRQIAVGDVLFFASDDKYTVVRTAGAEYLIRTTIAELAGQLDPAQFCQVHRATLINLAYLDSTRRDEASRLFLRMRGHPTELPVSRAYVHLFRAM